MAQLCFEPKTLPRKSQQTVRFQETANATSDSPGININDNILPRYVEARCLDRGYSVVLFRGGALRNGHSGVGIRSQCLQAICADTRARCAGESHRLESLPEKGVRTSAKNCVTQNFIDVVRGSRSRFVPIALLRLGSATWLLARFGLRLSVGTIASMNNCQKNTTTRLLNATPRMSINHSVASKPRSRVADLAGGNIDLTASERENLSTLWCVTGCDPRGLCSPAGIALSKIALAQTCGELIQSAHCNGSNV
jgi:hypothetical protein